MLAAERQSRILEELKRERSVTVARLGQLLGVSEVTIRKDLIKLESEGLLTRIHGGATLVNYLPAELSFTEKSAERMEEKRAIAERAIRYVHDGDTLMIGAGTTTMELARLLRRLQGLTVVTNAVNIAMELNSQGLHEVILIGGEMRHKSYALVGPIAERALQELYVSKCFLGADGVHPERGFSTLNMGEAQVNRTMMERSRKVYVLADSSKFGKVHLARFAALADADRIITDRLEAEERRAYEEQGVVVETADGREIGGDAAERGNG